MSLQNEDVERIAHLARLAVDPGDLPRYAGELSRILDLVDVLQRVDTAEVAPMAHPLSATQRLRTDQVTEADRRELFQSVAPLVEDGLYLVPKVIE